MRSFRLFVCSLVSGIALALLPACGEREPETPAGVVVDEYTVRGVIVAVPSAENPTGDFLVHHEEIPEFRGEGGERGMNEMIMPFPLSSDLDLSGYSEGDRVSLTFTVDYNEEEDRLITYRATSIEMLPEGTVLEFEEGAETGETSESDGG
jgi:hypothetical protein